VEDNVLFVRVGPNSGINGEGDGRYCGDIDVSIDELETCLIYGGRKVKYSERPSKEWRATDLLLCIANIEGDLGRAKLGERGSVAVVLPVDGGLLAAGEGGALGRAGDLEKG
jgi:hypothetical protein